MLGRFNGRVTSRHGGAMARYHDLSADKLVDMVSTARITFSVNAHINLVCSARLDREPKRRGTARVKELLARGVNVITSQDDVNDPYYPFGKPDPLECAVMLAHVAQLTLPHELEQVMDMITINAARAARVSDYGIAPGMSADLDRKSTRLNSSHQIISYAVFCLKKKITNRKRRAVHDFIAGSVVLRRSPLPPNVPLARTGVELPADVASRRGACRLSDYR